MRSAGHRAVTALFSLSCVYSKVVKQVTRHSQDYPLITIADKTLWRVCLNAFINIQLVMHVHMASIHTSILL